ncbi:sensor histidine kinase [Corynebacterium glyciniphilum]|nr:sensor histidine kinase [Corynebacterium glyciniphilum]
MSAQSAQEIDRSLGRDVPGWAVDAAMTVVVAVVLVSVVALSQVGMDHRPDLGAFIFVTAFGGVLLIRRHFPLTVLWLSILGTFAYYSLEYPPIGVALPVVAALFSTAERGLVTWAVAGGSVVFVVSLAFRVRDDPQPIGYLLGTESVSTLALIAAAVSLGYGLHARRLYVAQQEEIARLNKVLEREHISRELHDTVGHGLSVISLQAGVARDALGDGNPTAAAAVDQIRAQSSATLTELRTMLRLLRSEPDINPRGVHSLADLGGLLEEARAGGLEVTTHVDVAADELSPIVDATAYRIIQESLTNVLRHAGASAVEVTVSAHGSMLVVRVSDNGKGVSDSGTRPGGLGLTGMQERVKILGGRLVTQTHGGFTVAATLPTRLES